MANTLKKIICERCGRKTYVPESFYKDYIKYKEIDTYCSHCGKGTRKTENDNTIR